jgi:tetratricopeptide (TPR) repeat protein
MIKLFSTLIFICLLSVQNISAQKETSKDEQLLKKGLSFFDAKNYKTAIQYFDSCIVVNTENTEAYAYRGLAKYELKHYNEAIEDFDLTLILAPGYAEVYYFRALAKLEIGANDKACEDLYAAYDYGFKKAMRVIENVCKEADKN